MPTPRPSRPRPSHPPRRRGRPKAGSRPDRLQERPSPPALDTGERLQKFLARAGIASRRQCETFIAAGRVQVNGQVVRTLGTRVRPERDRVQVDGETVRAETLVTVLLHKPAGTITSRSDPQGRPVVTSLVQPGGLPRLFPVGRLDWDTEGLLLLTNDGELANALTHPRYGVRKVYHAKLKGHPTPESLARLTRGVMCDGEPLRARGVDLLHPTRQNAWIAVTLEQGRYRQVRRMCEAIGHPVLKLIRVALGPIRLGSLPRGQWRHLLPAELQALRALIPDADSSGA
ncbi:MAG: rRNA pseudouridine synthase [candidate division NC10 bacterium]|nr:rRNA pseudouridine synthase [candidate division NC10 bacterium]